MTTALIKDSIVHTPNDFTKLNSIERKGRLIKGLVGPPASVPTIPSRYLTVITENNENKGFQRSSKRFQYNFTDTPGPGSYGSVVDLSEKIKKTSDSKKGYGGFASASSRSETKLNPENKPAVGAYHPENTDLYRKKDFSTGNSSVFKKPIAQKVVKESDIPAPNEYNVLNAKRQMFKSNNVCADSAFKSHTKRDFLDLSRVKNLPAPGTYNPNDEVIRESSKIPYSSFKSTSQRYTFVPNENIPGPGEYSPNEPITEGIYRQLFPRRHYLAISAPAVPMAPELAMPGPGAYEIRDFKEPEKKYMSSAVFISSTGRWLNNTGSKNLPGPANYSPSKITKQSFHYNNDRKWI